MQTNEHYDVVDYDALIMAVPKDYLRLESLYGKLVQGMPARRLLFVGNDEVGRLVEASDLGDRVDFVNEEDILTFDEVNDVMKDALKDKLQGNELPRGVTGWYYQQFLKMGYSKICKDEYYMTWDGDTIPCKMFSMFKEGTYTPYFDLKTEFYGDYFETLGRLFPGMGKVIGKSFISEHMLFKTEYMRELIDGIEANNNIRGRKFYEKIIYAIDPDKLIGNGFSEFETYGTFVALKHMTSYMLREWHSFRLGGCFYNPKTISEDDLEWLSRDFQAISFEKGHTVRDDCKNLFDNKKYQSKLSARQMLEIAQEEFKEGSWKEEWD